MKFITNIGPKPLAPSEQELTARTVKAADAEIGRLSEQLRYLREVLNAERIERDTLIAQRDKAFEERNEAIAERDEARRKLNAIQDIVSEDEDDDEHYRVWPL